jgi:predicted SprT family Zn-dependent metalloprotease
LISPRRDRLANSHGYFAADRFTARSGEFRRHELALNPDGFIGQSDAQVCQTLVHEQVHLWQHAFGKPSGRGYHNTEWAAKMKAVGLQPSSTGPTDCQRWRRRFNWLPRLRHIRVGANTRREN